MINIGTLWAKFFLRIHGKSVRNSKINRSAKIFYGSNVLDSKIGECSYCGYNCLIVFAEIGKYCSIGSNVRIGGASHPMNWVSTSPVFHSGKNVLNKHFATHNYITNKKTLIGHDVWIGDNVLIKSGVTIGNGAVIGMGSVVTKDVGDYEVYAGCPATLIKKRFDDETIKKLQLIQWWNEDDETLKEWAVFFTDPNLLFEKIDSVID